MTYGVDVVQRLLTLMMWCCKIEITHDTLHVKKLLQFAALVCNICWSTGWPSVLDVETGCYPSIAAVKPQSNRPLYSNTVIGTLAVDGWAVTFGTAKRGLGPSPPKPLLAVPNQFTHQRSVYQLHIIQCSTIIAFGVWRVNMVVWDPVGRCGSLWVCCCYSGFVGIF